MIIIIEISITKYGSEYIEKLVVKSDDSISRIFWEDIFWQENVFFTWEMFSFLNFVKMIFFEISRVFPPIHIIIFLWNKDFVK